MEGARRAERAIGCAQQSAAKANVKRHPRDEPDDAEVARQDDEEESQIAQREHEGEE